ncbi:MAG: hypothetical protein EBV03_06015 [Proteobacteria bacterium]|nr:hypothetical protein [Pseudomonadota bacterium]
MADGAGVAADAQDDASLGGAPEEGAVDAEIAEGPADVVEAGSKGPKQRAKGQKGQADVTVGVRTGVQQSGRQSRRVVVGHGYKHSGTRTQRGSGRYSVRVFY